MLHPNGSNLSSPRPAILLAEDLRKSYGRRPALRGLTFSLQPGRVLGFLGPNGAGKTTAIRILTTMLEPDAGRFVVAGIVSEYPDRIRRKIGVLPENLGFPKNVTGIEYLTFFGQLYGRTAADARTRGLALLEEVGLRQRAKSLVGTYSHGMRQRLGIARALVNDPAVVFLDEPTLGLDPRGQQELLALIRRIAREREVGVVLCSHALAEVEGICDDVVILSQGQVVAAGSVAEVLGHARKNVVRIHVPPPAVAKARRALAQVPNVLNVTVNGETPGWLTAELVDSAGGAPPEEPPVRKKSPKKKAAMHRRPPASAKEPPASNRVLEALVHAGIPVLSFEAGGGRLQDVFLDLTEEVIQ